jgi:hypothetical protein
MIRRYVLPVALPIVVIGGYILSSGIGGFMEDAWVDFLGPFLVTYWLGFGFTLAWDHVREAAHVEGASPTVLALLGVLGAVVIFAMLGGIGTLIDDPWLIGVAIAPGLQLAAPWLQKRHAETSDEGST